MSAHRSRWSKYDPKNRAMTQAEFEAAVKRRNEYHESLRKNRSKVVKKKPAKKPAKTTKVCHKICRRKNGKFKSCGGAKPTSVCHKACRTKKGSFKSC